MNNVFTPLAQACGQFGKAAFFGLALLSFCSTTVAAQVSLTQATTSPTTKIDFAGSEWKSPVDYAAVISADHVFVAQKIGVPDVKPTELTLYTGYGRMLNYMQADLAANAPIETIAVINFKRVLNELPADPILKDLEVGEFATLYSDLVAKLVTQ